MLLIFTYLISYLFDLCNHTFIHLFTYFYVIYIYTNIFKQLPSVLFKGFCLYCVLSHVVLVVLREILWVFLVVSTQYGKELLHIQHIALSISGGNVCSNEYQESTIEGLMNQCTSDHR